MHPRQRRSSAARPVLDSCRADEPREFIERGASSPSRNDDASPSRRALDRRRNCDRRMCRGGDRRPEHDPVASRLRVQGRHWPRLSRLRHDSRTPLSRTRRCRSVARPQRAPRRTPVHHCHRAGVERDRPKDRSLTGAIGVPTSDMGGDRSRRSRLLGNAEPAVGPVRLVGIGRLRHQDRQSIRRIFSRYNLPRSA